MYSPDFEYEYMPPVGMVKLEPGDVLPLRDGLLHIVEKVNDCNARCLPMTSKKKAVTFHKGCHDEKTVVRTEYGTAQHISTCVDRDMIVERRGPDGLKEFLAGKVSARKTTNEETTTETTEQTNDMKTASSKLRKLAPGGKKPIASPRGGLTAPAASVGTTDRQSKVTVTIGEPQKLSRTAFIDALFNGKHTKAEIVDLTFAQYGEGKEKNRKIIATRVHERPYWIKKAGGKPEWKEVAPVAEPKATK